MCLLHGLHQLTHPSQLIQFTQPSLLISLGFIYFIPLSHCRELDVKPEPEAVHPLTISGKPDLHSQKRAHIESIHFQHQKHTDPKGLKTPRETHQGQGRQGTGESGSLPLNPQKRQKLGPQNHCTWSVRPLVLMRKSLWEGKWPKDRLQRMPTGLREESQITKGVVPPSGGWNPQSQGQMCPQNHGTTSV